MTDVAATSASGRLRFSGLRVGVILSLLLLVGFASLVWTPYPVNAVDVGAALQDPGSLHWLGTDPLGRDVFSLLMKGILTSFIVAAIAVAIGAVIGIPLGLAAATWDGLADRAVLRVSDFLLVFPALVSAILIAAAAGPSEVVTMIAVGLFNVPVFARAARGGWLELKSLDYAKAARLSGMSGWEVAIRHLLPGLGALLLATATTQLAVSVLAEATISYIGLGAQTPTASLGLMLRDAQSYAMMKPSLMLLPGLAIVLIVASISLAGDGFRALLDPKLKAAGAVDGAA